MGRTREALFRREHGSGKQSLAHRRAPKQERELAKRSGGRLTPGSGSKTQKGDVRNAYGVFRIEAKTTMKKSFSVTREMVRKIEDASLPNGEVPAIVIEFLNDEGEPVMEVAVVPTYLLENLR
jgi:Holliday junction resolvase